MTQPTSPYSVHPSVTYARAVLDHLPAKTGRSLEEWVRLLESDGPGGAKERREWLKRAHGLGGTTAAMIAGYAAGSNAADVDPAACLDAEETAGYRWSRQGRPHHAPDRDRGTGGH
jgi:hypothetical protein